jgi:phosphate transport system protein
MLRHKFDQELQRLQDEVLVLGSLVEKALVESVELLKKRDQLGARRLIAGDRLINEGRYALEAETIALIATQQPMAGDMRLLAAILEIITELERIGDYAKGIARINLAIGDKPLLKPPTDLPVMADKACHMLRQALEAFIRRDVALARVIPRQDDEVDALYNQVFRELLSHIMSNAGTLEQATYLLWAAHNLERTADRVINICERVVYTATGEMHELDVDDAGIEGLA